MTADGPRVAASHASKLAAAAGSLLVLLLSVHSVAAIRPGGSDDGRAPTAGDTAVDQRRLVAELTGWGPEGQERPFARSTPEERARAASYLVAALEELGLEAGLHRYRLPHGNPLVDLLIPPFAGANVVAEVPATRPGGETVILGAHYDSKGGPGAVDNATGVAVVVAAAAEVAALERRDRRFLFVLFDQEEDSREAGSVAFARHLEEEEIPVHSVHNVDLAGWDPDGDRRVRVYSPDPELADPYRKPAAEAGIPLRVTGGAGADAGIDTGSFLRADFPALGVHQAHDGGSTFIHSPRDTYDKVDFDYLASTTRLVVGVMRRLAAPWE